MNYDIYQDRLLKRYEQDSGDIRESLRYLRGDHWQNGANYKGPTSGTSIGSEYSSGDYTCFTPLPVLKDIVTTNVQAACGKPPIWRVVRRGEDGNIVNSDDVDPLIVEATNLLRYWLKEERAHSTIVEAAEMCRAAGYAALRLYVDEEYLEGNAIVVEDLIDAMDIIALEAPSPLNATVVNKGRRRMGLYNFRNKDRINVIEVVRLRNGETVIEQHQSVFDRDFDGDVDADDLGGTPLSRHSFDFGGRLTMREMRADVLTTKPMRELQAAIDTTSTMMTINSIVAGFRMFVLLNVDLVSETYDANGEVTSSTTLDFEIGPGAYANLLGVQNRQESFDGSEKDSYAQPDIKVIDPSEVTAFTEPIEHYRMAMLRSASQEHRAISGGRRLSTESISMLRADFEASTLDLAQEVTTTYEWLLETVLAMAGAFVGDPRRFDSLEVVAQPQVDVGQLSVATRRWALDAYNSRFLTHEVALGIAGVKDAHDVALQVEHELERRAETFGEQQKALQDNGLQTGVDNTGSKRTEGFDPDDRQRSGGTDAKQ